MTAAEYTDNKKEILERAQIVEVIGHYVKLTRKGSTAEALCPFHHEKTPSFKVFEDHYHCFSCGAHGDVIDFLKAINQETFGEAIKRLGDMVNLPYFSRRTDSTAQEPSPPYVQTLTQVLARYQTALTNSSEALDYCHQRQITDEAITHFQIGYAPAVPHILTEQTPSSQATCLATLGLIKDYGEQQRELFRNRLMFPIYSPLSNGKLILRGFGGRLLEDGKPKYLNSPDSPHFNKGDILFGWSPSFMDSVRVTRQIVIVEGYLDVVACWQAGMDNVLASMGTALTQPQLELALHFADHVIIAFDGDTAGTKAAEKAARVVMRSLKAGKEVAFSVLQGGDPDEIIKNQGIATFRNHIETQLVDPVAMAIRPLLREQIHLTKMGRDAHALSQMAADIEACQCQFYRRLLRKRTEQLLEQM